MDTKQNRNFTAAHNNQWLTSKTQRVRLLRGSKRRTFITRLNNSSARMNHLEWGWVAYATYEERKDTLWSMKIGHRAHNTRLKRWEGNYVVTDNNYISGKTALKGRKYTGRDRWKERGSMTYDKHRHWWK